MHVYVYPCRIERREPCCCILHVNTQEDWLAPVGDQIRVYVMLVAMTIG